jgi:hypothetical protein
MVGVFPCEVQGFEGRVGNEVRTGGRREGKGKTGARHRSRK